MHSTGSEGGPGIAMKNGAGRGWSIPVILVIPSVSRRDMNRSFSRTMATEQKSTLA
jgi:hypothetical protein